MPEQAPLRAPGDAFDADAVWTLFGGRVDRMRQVWQISRTALPEAADALAAAVEARDWNAAARHAHAIAGSASHYGAHAVVASARRIEDHAGHGHVPASEVAAIRAGLDALSAAMTVWLDQVGPQ
jgi:HPt (histidine-containing phosphotransfer) domain-containing protein